MSDEHVPDIGADTPRTPEGENPKMDEVRADIAATRAELQDTVDALSDKLNVKKQGHEAVEAAKQKVTDAAASAKHSAPEPVQHALDRTAAATGPWMRQAAAASAPHRKEIFAGLAAAIVVFVVVRRRRRQP